MRYGCGGISVCRKPNDVGVMWALFHHHHYSAENKRGLQASTR